MPLYEKTPLLKQRAPGKLVRYADAGKLSRYGRPAGAYFQDRLRQSALQDIERRTNLTQSTHEKSQHKLATFMGASLRKSPNLF
jgi:hypothetical protein